MSRPRGPGGAAGLLLLAAALVVGSATGLARANPARVTRPPPYGRIVLQSPTSPDVPAVTFEHWLHRARFTCRVCHVDLGFALRAGDTPISAESNEAGQHCGACHDGKKTHEGRRVFSSCGGWPLPEAARGCTRCHTGPDAPTDGAFASFVRAMPVDSAGDVDWEAAERRKLVAPLDAVEGLSLHRKPMRIDRDLELRPVGTWMTQVTFSHKKHTAWLGCELCHPEIFPVTKRGSVRYGMPDIRAGRFCGACHLTVAFPVTTCDRCHEKFRPWR